MITELSGRLKIDLNMIVLGQFKERLREKQLSVCSEGKQVHILSPLTTEVD